MSSSAIPTADVRRVLRAHTKDTHNMLHRHSSFVGLFKQSLNKEDYRCLVARLHGFYAPLDRAIASVKIEPQAETGAFAYVPRTPLLRQDLFDLGFDERAINAVPVCSAAAEMVTPGNLGGVLYVVEGATFGGSVIDRAAARLMSDDEPLGRRYWSWCRSEHEQNWAQMEQYLDQLAPDAAQIEDLKQGAQLTFDVFADWLAPLHKGAPLVQGQAA